MELLDNKVAVITGSTRGLGLTIAQAYAREGAAIVVASRSPESVTQTNVQVIAGYEHLLQSFPAVVRVLGKPPQVAARKALWLASAATDGRTGLEVYLFNPAAMLASFLRDRIRRVTGQPDTSPQPHITPIPPAM